MNTFNDPDNKYSKTSENDKQALLGKEMTTAETTNEID